jgi:hypothetical protein
MKKKVKTIEEQIEILKTRGMIFEDEKKAKEILRDIGYYRLGFYWFYFQKSRKKHTFRENTQFSTIVKLYYLDNDLRFLLTKALSRIEINLRTQLVYIVSTNYSDNPTWFADNNIMEDCFIRDFRKIYRGIKDNNSVISKHHKNHNDNYAPAWKTLEFVTLGSLKKIFDALKDESVKDKIAKEYGIKRLDIFNNYLKAIVDIRNVCSHTRVLYDFNYEDTIKSTSICKILPEERNSLNAIIKVILYFLATISINRSNELKNEIEKLIQNNVDNQEIANIIKEKMKISL